MKLNCIIQRPTLYLVVPSEGNGNNQKAGVKVRSCKKQKLNSKGQPQKHNDCRSLQRETKAKSAKSWQQQFDRFETRASKLYLVQFELIAK